MYELASLYPANFFQNGLDFLAGTVWKTPEVHTENRVITKSVIPTFASSNRSTRQDRGVTVPMKYFQTINRIRGDRGYQINIGPGRWQRSRRCFPCHRLINPNRASDSRLISRAVAGDATKLRRRRIKLGRPNSGKWYFLYTLG